MFTTNKLRFIHRPANQRGKADFGWLKSRHSFSFGNYYDTEHMGFANLRVINDDIVSAGKGFATHPHQNAEIFSYVLDGALEHEDTLGNGSVVNAGGVQFMSAGSGISHSEFNPSITKPIRFLQIWLLPSITDTPPYYDVLDIVESEKDGKLKLFLSHDGREASIQTHATADVYCATLSGDQHIESTFDSHRKVWIQMVKGSMMVNDRQLHEGDGLALVHDVTSDISSDIIEKESALIHMNHGQEAEFLYFELW